MCCKWLAENTGCKKSPFWHHCTTLSGCLFAAKATIGKSLLDIDTSSTCPHNMVNFGLLMAEIRWRVWGTPANFNGFHVLAALLHSTLVVGVSHFVALNRGRHLYSAGRPSRRALAHIPAVCCFSHATTAFWHLVNDQTCIVRVTQSYNTWCMEHQNQTVHLIFAAKICQCNIITNNS